MKMYLVQFVTLVLFLNLIRTSFGALETEDDVNVNPDDVNPGGVDVRQQGQGKNKNRGSQNTKQSSSPKETVTQTSDKGHQKTIVEENKRNFLLGVFDLLRDDQTFGTKEEDLGKDIKGDVLAKGAQNTTCTSTTSVKSALENLVNLIKLENLDNLEDCSFNSTEVVNSVVALLTDQTMLCHFETITAEFYMELVEAWYLEIQDETVPTLYNRFYTAVRNKDFSYLAADLVMCFSDETGHVLGDTWRNMSLRDFGSYLTKCGFTLEHIKQTGTVPKANILERMTEFTKLEQNLLETVPKQTMEKKRKEQLEEASGEIPNYKPYASDDGESVQGTPAQGTQAQGGPTAGAPAGGLPAEGASLDGAPAGIAPAEAAPAEAAPAGIAPAEAAPAEAAPAEAAPAEAAPADAAPAEAAPAEAAPAEATPAEATPAEATPAEATPAEVAPAEVAPAEATPAEVAPVEEAYLWEAPGWEAAEGNAPERGMTKEGAPKGGTTKGGKTKEGAPKRGAPIGGAPKGGAPKGRAPEGRASKGKFPEKKATEAGEHAAKDPKRVAHEMGTRGGKNANEELYEVVDVITGLILLVNPKFQAQNKVCSLEPKPSDIYILLDSEATYSQRLVIAQSLISKCSEDNQKKVMGKFYARMLFELITKQSQARKNLLLQKFLLFISNNKSMVLNCVFEILLRFPHMLEETSLATTAAKYRMQHWNGGKFENFIHKFLEEENQSKASADVDGISTRIKTILPNAFDGIYNKMVEAILSGKIRKPVTEILTGETNVEYVPYSGKWFVYSHFYNCTFTGVPMFGDDQVTSFTYHCVEKWIMLNKALLFKDMEVAGLIKQMTQPVDPSVFKALGRVVKGFKLELWNQWNKEILYQGNGLKYMQNPTLFVQLKADIAGRKRFVEANIGEKIYGVGLCKDDPRAKNKGYWRGDNLSGDILMDLWSDICSKGCPIKDRYGLKKIGIIVNNSIDVEQLS